MGTLYFNGKPYPMAYGAKAKNQDKVITQNGTYTADEGYTGLGTVNVNVSGGGSSEWQPDPDWWDIKTILEEDTRDYAGKAIILYSNSDDFTRITISSPCVAVATSDGAFYTSTSTHTWDKSKDKIVGSDASDTTPKYGTRYLILYFNTVDVLHYAFRSFYASSIYAIFNCNITGSFGSSNTFFDRNYTIQSFDFLGDFTFKSTSFSNFCFGCYSLAKLPNSLNTSNITDFSYFCYGCYSLTKLPDNLDTSSGTNFYNFCCNCSSLVKLPDNLDTSSGTNFYNFCGSCSSLVKLPDSLDTSSGTDFTSFCSSCSSLTKLPDNLDTSSGTNFSRFCGDCYSLTKLPDNLDTSSGTSFSMFCTNCYSLTKLPDNLDISSGTNLGGFCGACSSLTKANIKLGTTSITSLSGSGTISIDSLRYIADNAPTVTTATTLTIGSTNITRAGGADGYVVQTLTSKGWTVN